jgi:hypothetical protein
MARIPILLVFSTFAFYAQAVRQGWVCNQPGFTSTFSGIKTCKDLEARVVDWDEASPTVSISPLTYTEQDHILEDVVGGTY